MRLRSIELNVPKAVAARHFFTHASGAWPTPGRRTNLLSARLGPLPYLVALTEADDPSIRCTTFVGTAEEISDIAMRARADRRAGARHHLDRSRRRPGRAVQLPEGEVLRFLHDDTSSNRSRAATCRSS
jgi:2,3-dihydroxy-p-cumate/2,3-dihydroxybenzoate 3,4-dioxygenase